MQGMVVLVLLRTGCGLAGVGLIGRGLPAVLNTPRPLRALRKWLLGLKRVFNVLTVLGAFLLLVAATVHLVRTVL
jgi:hypothetical protein